MKEVVEQDEKDRENLEHDIQRGRIGRRPMRRTEQINNCTVEYCRLDYINCTTDFLEYVIL